MFRSSRDKISVEGDAPERVTSVLGEGISWQGKITGSGGVRIEGAFDGDIELKGLVVIAERGRVSCKQIRAETVVVAGSVKSDIAAQRVVITSTGRVWGGVVTTSFSTEEGAFLRGQVTMEDDLDLGFGVAVETTGEKEEVQEED